VADDAALTTLALRAREGDTAAATLFDRQTHSQLWRMLVALSDRQVAEDLAQETYARAFRSLPGFRGESPIRPWLLSIARRVAADHIRAARTRPRTDPRVGLDDDIAPAVGGDLAEAAVLRGLVAELDLDRRTAFVLTQLLGLSYLEVAPICDFPVGTVRSRRRTRNDLITQLAGAHRTASTSRTVTRAHIRAQRRRGALSPRAACATSATDPTGCPARRTGRTGDV
jgi:RNA polymerase sigma-70 factor (ECF subfamily)